MTQKTPASSLSPIENFLPRLKTCRSYSNGYYAPCPSHNDKHPSLMIWEDANGNVGLKCFAGCSRAAIVEAVGLTESDLYRQDGNKPPRQLRPALTSMELAIEKIIHPHFIDNLGVVDGPMTFHPEGKEPYARKGVIIPYFNEDGTLYERTRFRTSLVAKEGSYWNDDSEAPLIPYGLQTLAQARAAGYLIIVEGETDCWTLWQHGFLAIGVPGATNEQALDVRHLQGIERVYIVEEDDNAGKQFASKLEKRLKKQKYAGKLYKIEMSATGANDPNALQKKDIKGFKANFETIINRAIPLFVVGKKPEVYRLCDLQDEILPPMKWAIPDILPEGLTWLCGKPKLGKSWILLSMMLSITFGGVALGNVPVEQGEVLYISLEDNKRRLQKRTNKLLNYLKASPDFYGSNVWPRMNEGGIEALEEWLIEHPRTRLVGIDTWGRFKPVTHNSQRQQYDEDYDALTPLQELASKYGVSIVVVHHMRKQESEDPIDMVLGSVANAGAVDGFLLLYRKRGETDARLFVTGRDVETEEDLLLTFNPEKATWAIKDENEPVATPVRQSILDLLKQASNGLGAREIAEKLGKNLYTTRNLLASLRKEGKIVLEDSAYRLVRHGETSERAAYPASQAATEPHYGGNYADGSVVSDSEGKPTEPHYDNVPLVRHGEGMNELVESTDAQPHYGNYASLVFGTPAKNERGLPVKCSQCRQSAKHYGAGALPYCPECWQRYKTQQE